MLYKDQYVTDNVQTHPYAVSRGVRYAIWSVWEDRLIINTPYSINLNMPYGSDEGQYAILIIQNTPYCLEEQKRCLDCRNQYDVLSGKVDTSYPTGGHGVSVDLSE
ncbi:hypothetical protein Tco_0365010 [Tanacetum coccineum]